MGCLFTEQSNLDLYTCYTCFAAFPPTQLLGLLVELDENKRYFGVLIYTYKLHYLIELGMVSWQSRASTTPLFSYFYKAQSDPHPQDNISYSTTCSILRTYPQDTGQIRIEVACMPPLSGANVDDGFRTVRLISSHPISYEGTRAMPPYQHQYQHRPSLLTATSATVPTPCHSMLLQYPTRPACRDFCTLGDICAS